MSGVLDPVRPVEVQRHGDQPATEHRQRVETRLEEPQHVLETNLAARRGRRVIDAQPGDVHVLVAALELQEKVVRAGELFHAFLALAALPPHCDVTGAPRGVHRRIPTRDLRRTGRRRRPAGSLRAAATGMMRASCRARSTAAGPRTIDSPGDTDDVENDLDPGRARRGDFRWRRARRTSPPGSPKATPTPGRCWK